jgi:hypothetical protein
MAVRRTLLCALLLAWPLLALSPAQDSNSSNTSDAVSSDDIRVADGLQLPTYGHMWLLDSWEGVKELVELHVDASSDHGISLKFHRSIDLKGESAAVRCHDLSPQLFARGIGEDDSGTVRPEFVVVRLNVVDNHREATKDSQEKIGAIAKGRGGASTDVIEMKQARVGDTDWYRLSPARPLDPGEYALVSLPGSPAAALNEIYDFAVDPQAPENPQALRSERDRASQQ